MGGVGVGSTKGDFKFSTIFLINCNPPHVILFHS
jgi:hypothetical protein